MATRIISCIKCLGSTDFSTKQEQYTVPRALRRPLTQRCLPPNNAKRSWTNKRMSVRSQESVEGGIVLTHDSCLSCRDSGFDLMDDTVRKGDAI